MTPPSNKRPRIGEIVTIDDDDDSDVAEVSSAAWASSTKARTSRTSISPPPSRKAKPEHGAISAQSDSGSREPGKVTTATDTILRSKESDSGGAVRLIPSPLRLSTVEGLADEYNADTVSLKNILGDPMINECWLFNYLFDVDFIMSQFDKDTRDLVQVKLVHGSWRKEDPNRIGIEEASNRYLNIQVITAYMPEQFGTHHSKMIILFRHDDLAQIIVLTANFIERDWNMCQGLWLSPLLPVTEVLASSVKADVDSTSSAVIAMNELEEEKWSPPGSGSRFKMDLLAYIRAYGPSRTASLAKSLSKYDFSAVKAALVASVPGKQNLRAIDPGRETLWGWPVLKQVLRSIKHFDMNQQQQDLSSSTSSGFDTQAATKDGKSKETEQPTQKPHITMQVSSVASVGDKWMQQTFLPALATFPFLSIATPLQKPQPSFSLIFPTASTIQQSVNGYASGASIHMKLSSPAQQKQLQYLRSMLCHWSPPKTSPPSQFFTGRPRVTGKAMRRRAAPHIKTYFRFSSSKLDKIDWALLTSANLSTQAWGAAEGAGGEVRICSYEIGVLVWPALWAKKEMEGVEMVPVFGRDMPQGQTSSVGPNRGDTIGTDNEDSGGADQGKDQTTVIGLRMPYDLPLTSYTASDMPWCAEERCDGLDCKGRPWPGSRKK